MLICQQKLIGGDNNVLEEQQSPESMLTGITV
jgi:hypothetical protein